jgi:hypothetical protein
MGNKASYRHVDDNVYAVMCTSANALPEAGVPLDKILQFAESCFINFLLDLRPALQAGRQQLALLRLVHARLCNKHAAAMMKSTTYHWH